MSNIVRYNISLSLARSLSLSPSLSLSLSLSLSRPLTLSRPLPHSYHTSPPQPPFPLLFLSLGRHYICGARTLFSGAFVATIGATDALLAQAQILKSTLSSDFNQLKF